MASLLGFLLMVLASGGGVLCGTLLSAPASNELIEIRSGFFSFSFSASIFASFEHELTPLVGESDGGVDDGDSDSRVRSLFVLRQAGISKVQMSRARIGLSPPAVASTVDKYI